MMAFGFNSLRAGKLATKRLARWGARAEKYQKSGSGLRRLFHPIKAKRSRRRAQYIRHLAFGEKAPTAGKTPFAVKLKRKLRQSKRQLRSTRPTAPLKTPRLGRVGSATRVKAGAYSSMRKRVRRGLYIAGGAAAGYGGYRYRQNRKQRYGY